MTMDDLTSALSQTLSFGNWEGKSATFGSKNGSGSLAPGGDPLHPFFGKEMASAVGTGFSILISLPSSSSAAKLQYSPYSPATF